MALIGKNVVAPSLLVAIFTAQAMPATASVIGWGRVNMEGAIVNAACALESASRDQTIDMKTLPVEQISRDGHGLTRPFTLKLVNCGLSGDNSANSGRQHFRMIFDGNAEGKTSASSATPAVLHCALSIASVRIFTLGCRCQ